MSGEPGGASGRLWARMAGRILDCLLMGSVVALGAGATWILGR